MREEREVENTHGRQEEVKRSLSMEGPKKMQRRSDASSGCLMSERDRFGVLVEHSFLGDDCGILGQAGQNINHT
jgi:hypothetical protein